MPELTLSLSEPIATAHEKLSDAGTRPTRWTLTDANQTYVLWSDSIQAMVTMGLGSWPLSAIALPESLARKVYSLPPQTRNISTTRTTVLPAKLINVLDTMGAHLVTLNTHAYVVGGLVRDVLLAIDSANPATITSPDVDITVEGQAIPTAQALHHVWPELHVCQTFEAFGTAKLQLKEQFIDMASTRTEYYQALGVLPTIKTLGVSLADDVKRRDFTVNTLALAVHQPGLVLDTEGGLADLASGLLRMLTPHSCYEDPSRVMRAFKYAMRLDFQWSPDTQYLIELSLAHMAAHAPHAQPPFEGGGERVRIEWEECLALPESSVKTQWLSQFFELGAWRVMLPSLPASTQPVVSLTAFAHALEQTADQRAQNGSSTADLYWLVCLLSMPDKQREQAMARLGCRKGLVEALTQCHACLITRTNPFDTGLSVTDPVAIVDLCTSLSPLALWFLALTSDDVTTSAAIMAAYTTTFAAIKPVLTGRDLQAMGVTPGPRMGDLLKGLLHAKLLGSIVTASDEREWIQRELAGSTD